MGIQEFSDDPRCILRLGVATARADVELADGTVVRRGDTVGVLHLWNEHMPQIPPNGPDLAWAKEFKRSLVLSFRLLASHVAQDPALADIQAIVGDIPLTYTPATIRMLQRIGLQVITPAPPRGLVNRGIDLGMRIWTWLLRRAFNPGSMQDLRLSDLHHRSVWSSRRTLIALHGSDDPAANQS
jgi:hypothetical protein